MNVKNTIDKTCDKCRSFKENQNYKDTVTNKEMDDIWRV